MSAADVMDVSSPPPLSASGKSGNSTKPPHHGLLLFCLELAVHALCLLVYLIPICWMEHPFDNHASPTLDEIHIMSQDNQDIRGGTNWTDAFLNDYWGRRMDNPSSHKSWRPLTVLSFRWLQGLYTHQEITVHRVVNVLTHAAVADLVGRLGARVMLVGSSHAATPTATTILRLLIKVVFALHPTHVEAAANSANRNHILAVLLSLTASDYTLSLPWTMLALVAGFLCSETFVFQIPAILVTNVVLRYSDELRMRLEKVDVEKNGEKDVANDDDDTSVPTSFVQTVVWYLYAILAVLPRVVLAILVTLTYLGGRHYFDTLSIPDGLIRPAENPFADFQGAHRIRNYMYVLAVHMGKSWGIVDPIGFSHEYGRDCVSPLETWQDPRIFQWPLGMAATLLAATIAILALKPVTLSGPLFLHWAWLLTLLPISGLFKVGTFISDRIVVASTVSVSMWLGYGIYMWWSKWRTQAIPFPAPLQTLVVAWLFLTSYHRIHARTMEWMDSTTLIASSLKTCPRFGKAHMEASKLHSGMHEELLDFDKSLWHLRMAEESDPDLCDVHLQFAYIAIQQGRYDEYEDRITQAVLCPFSMGGALPQWKQYWQVTLNSAKNNPEEYAEVQRRQEFYAGIIQRAVEEEQAKEEMKKRMKEEEEGW